LRDDTAALLERRDLSPAMRGMLEASHADLQALLGHLESGGELGELPVLVQTIRPADAPMSREELAAALRGQDLQEIEVEQVVLESASEPPPEPSPGVQGPRPSFGDTLQQWLNTPAQVSWQDIRRRSGEPGKG
jgi:hypothetical protein